MCWLRRLQGIPLTTKTRSTAAQNLTAKVISTLDPSRVQDAKAAILKWIRQRNTAPDGYFKEVALRVALSKWDGPHYEAAMLQLFDNGALKPGKQLGFFQLTPEGYKQAHQ